MTDLSCRILTDYQVRKSKQQKQSFIRFMEEMFPEITVETSKAPKNQNLVIGNIENAQVILSAHYDTCAKMLIPNFITPLNHVFSILY